MRKLLLFFCTIFFLAGCVNEVELDKDISPDSTMENVSEYITQETTEKTTEKTTEENTEDSTEYFDVLVSTDETPGDIVYSIEKVEVPPNAEMSSWFLYDKYIFYAYDYSDYLTAQDIVPDTDGAKSEYAGKILMLDMETGESRVIRSIANTDAMISDIEYNGRYLKWFEDTIENCITRVLDMKTGDMVFDASRRESGCRYATITKDYIFWIGNEVELDGKERYSLYRYDFETKDTVELIKKEFLNDNFSIEVSQKVITVCSSALERPTHIMGYDFDGNLLYNYETDGLVTSSYCNSYGVVWRRGIEAVLFYEAESGKIYNLGYAPSIVLIGDCIVMGGSYGGIYSYTIGSNIRKCVVKDENRAVVGLDVDLNGDVHGRWITAMQAFPGNSNEVIMLKISQIIKLN